MHRYDVLISTCSESRIEGSWFSPDLERLLSALAREITNLVAGRRVDGKETLSSQVALTLSQSAHSKCGISPGLFTYWFKKTLTDFSFIVYFYYYYFFVHSWTFQTAFHLNILTCEMEKSKLFSYRPYRNYA